MQEIGRLIMVCKAMPGFCEKSRDLCEPARKAIVQAIILSGQTAPVTAQRYIAYPGTTGLSPSDRNGSATSGIANLRTLNSLPCVREVNEQPAAGVPNPAPFSEPAASGQLVENVPNLQPQWQPDAELIRRQETTARTAPATGQRYIDYPGTAAMSSNSQVGSATDRQTLNTLPPVQNANMQSADGGPTPALFSVPVPEATSQQIQNVQNLRSRWTNAELGQQQESVPQTASFGHPSNADHSLHATSTDSHTEAYSGASQEYRNAGADGSTWNGTTLGTGYQDVEVDRHTWNFDFPMPSFWS